LYQIVLNITLIENVSDVIPDNSI